jgi:hypothetical protein
MSLKPSVQEMLLIAQDCGLTTLEEAFNNYMNHYDMFFLISDYENQKKAFDNDAIKLGLVDHTEQGLFMKEISIDDALELIK